MNRKKRLFLLIPILIVVMLSFLSKSSSKKGGNLPMFNLLNEKGQVVNSKDLPLPMVLFFYPKNNTPVCTKEACSFRDHLDLFTKHGVNIVGVSNDNMISHQQFKEQYNLQYPLMTDINGEARKKLGVSKFLGVVEGRVTFVVNEEGKIIHIFNSPMQSEKHVEEALKALGIENSDK